MFKKVIFSEKHYIFNPGFLDEEKAWTNLLSFYKKEYSNYMMLAKFSFFSNLLQKTTFITLFAT